MLSVRRTLLSALAVAAMFAALVAPIQSANAAGGPVTKMLVWGDSMTQVWWTYLQDELQIPVEWHGVGAETIQETKGHFDAWINDPANAGVLATTGHICWCGIPT